MNPQFADGAQNSNAKVQRWRPFQWSLRTFLVMVLLAALLTGWIVQRFIEVRTTPISVSVVGQLTSGSETILNPPSDREVVWAVERLSTVGVQIPGGFVVSKVEKELVETRTDPVRTVPLLGPVALHHQIYRCKLYGQCKGVPEFHVVLVDLNHFHLQGSVKNSAMQVTSPE